jgi:hypothetical protein
MPEHGEEDFGHAEFGMRQRHAIGIAEVTMADQFAIQRAGSGNIAFDDGHSTSM